MNSGLTSRDKSLSIKGTRLILIYSCIDLPPLLLLYTHILLPSSSIFVTSLRKSACHLNTTFLSPHRTPIILSHIPVTTFETETTPIGRSQWGSCSYPCCPCARALASLRDGYRGAQGQDLRDMSFSRFCI